MYFAEAFAGLTPSCTHFVCTANTKGTPYLHRHNFPDHTTGISSQSLDSVVMPTHPTRDNPSHIDKLLVTSQRCQLFAQLLSVYCEMKIRLKSTEETQTASPRYRQL
jgi:hypothetical protein